MKNEYYPISHEVCLHTYNKGGCTFCGYKHSRVVSKVPLSVEDRIGHFRSFVDKNMQKIEETRRLVVGPNGSFWLEVHPEVRKEMYDFVEEKGIQEFCYEGRASHFTKEKAYDELAIRAKALESSGWKRKASQDMGLLENALEEIGPGHNVGLGVEVADDDDLRSLNKGCVLDDYVKAADYIHSRGATTCCNILIKPHRVKDGYRKTFRTAKFGRDVLGATEFLLMPAIPMRGTPQYDDWKGGIWNPASATASSEILRILKVHFSDVRIKYIDLRVFNFHGRYGSFRREPGKWTEEEKERERQMIRDIASEEMYPVD